MRCGGCCGGGGGGVGQRAARGKQASHTCALHQWHGRRQRGPAAVYKELCRGCDRGDAAWSLQVVQRRQGMGVHYPGRWRARRLRTPERDPNARVPFPGRRRRRGVRVQGVRQGAGGDPRVRAFSGRLPGIAPAPTLQETLQENSLLQLRRVRESYSGQVQYRAPAKEMSQLQERRPPYRRLSHQG